MAPKKLKTVKRTKKAPSNIPLPPLNARLKEYIHQLSGDSVSKMAVKLNTTQQRLNRLFLIDERTNKYPIVPTDIILSFLEVYPQIDARQFLLGEPQEITEPVEAKISYNDLKDMLEQCQARYAKLMMRLERKEEELEALHQKSI